MTQQHAHSHPLGPGDLAAILLVVGVWGINFVFMKIGLASLTPFQLGAGRYLLAFLPLALVIRRPRVRARWLLAFGLSQGVGQFGLLFIALQAGMSAALASVLLQTQVFFSAFFGVMLLGEGISRPLKAGMVFAAAGLACALGLALTLAELPRRHAGHAHALKAYRQLMDALLPFQTRDGLWRNVVDVPGAYAEFSATAMIGYALQRGLREGWISGRRYRQAADRAWEAVNARSGEDGTFIDVCESTTRMTSVQQYLQRAAILGEDPRGGAMAMLFATERMEDGKRWNCAWDLAPCC